MSDAPMTPAPPLPVPPLTEEQENLLRTYESKMTPAPWAWQDGCSWRRIGHKGDGDVICPTYYHRGGIPDLFVPNHYDGEGVVLLRNLLPGLLASLTEARERAERATGLLREFVAREGDGCRLDHNGFCQEHLSGPCLVAEAKSFLGPSSGVLVGG